MNNGLYIISTQTYVDLFSPSERGDYDGPRIGLTNTTTLIISLISIGFLVVNEEVIKVYLIYGFKSMICGSH